MARVHLMGVAFECISSVKRVQHHLYMATVITHYYLRFSITRSHVRVRAVILFSHGSLCYIYSSVDDACFRVLPLVTRAFAPGRESVCGTSIVTYENKCSSCSVIICTGYRLWWLVYWVYTTTLLCDICTLNSMSRNKSHPLVYINQRAMNCLH